jgi:prevent-host-death family protein
MKVTIHEAKTHLSRLIQRALAGEEIIIAKGNAPVAKLIPIPEAIPERRVGGIPGLILYMSPDFDDPLPDFQEYAPVS